MRKRMSATNLKWACGWLAAAVLALCWWLPLPFRSTADDGPQRIYGNPEARFTITLYADLECPRCQAYLPQLQRWIVTNDHVNLVWRHLPLPQHEPAASREARRVECLGQSEGREGVWGPCSGSTYIAKATAVGWLLDTTIRTSARPCNAAWPANGLPKSWTRKKRKPWRMDLTLHPHCA